MALSGLGAVGGDDYDFPEFGGDFNQGPDPRGKQSIVIGHKDKWSGHRSGGKNKVCGGVREKKEKRRKGGRAKGERRRAKGA